MKKVILAVYISLVCYPVFGALSITATTNANTLAGRLVASGSGVSVTAVSITVPGNGIVPSGLYQGGPFNIIDGVIITNGAALNALPPNTAPDRSSNLGISYNEPLVDAIAGADVLSFDTVIFSITFDVENWVNSVAFDFIFGSEEYPEYVGWEYNDLFGAFLNGSQIVFDQFGAAITINGPFFSSSLVKVPPANGMEYDGSTTVLVTKASVLPGSTGNVMQFVISDVGDSFYDSGALLANFRGEAEIVGTPVTNPFTPTVTNTPTVTRTHTSTPTPSFTRTATMTVTQSVTPSATRTVTETSTITETHTITPTITETHTITPTFTITQTHTATPTATNTPVPFVMALEGNFPNPLDSDTQIVYWLSRDAVISLNVFTVSGEPVRETAGIQGLAGNNSLYFDGKNKRGKPLASGVYIYKISGRTERNESASFTSKMSVVK